MKFKWYFFSIMMALILTGCSKDESESEPAPEPEKQNLAPDVPVQVFPKNNADCTAENLILQWEAAVDPEEDLVLYKIQVSTDREFQQIAYSRSTTGLQVKVSLERGVVYYWRIQASDYKNQSEFSSVHTFYTEPDPEFNSIPFQPSRIHPGSASALDENPVKLQWTAEDPDGDELVYDLYLGREDPPQLFKADLQENSLEVNVEAGSTYFWKIVAKDVFDAKAVGEVWKFSVN